MTELENAGINSTQIIHNDTYPFIDPANKDLSGRSVLITGASKGIGRSTALSFARAGASNIAIAARSSLIRGRYVSCTWDMGQLLEKKEEIMKKELLKVRLCVA